MATKTFKIGLSTSDKSAMAQDVYERLIAMCFDEYDSTKVYNAGDFVVYENPADTFKLYKCKEDNVTGTWNSAKWELATFQDLVDDVEGAVASVDGKANVDGNYPTMTVGLADNLTPYDEESGDDQDEPFSFQATGTANGTQSDFATGSGALLREKQGHTLVVNQLLHNNDMSNGSSYWYTNSATVSASNGKLSVTPTAKFGGFIQSIKTIAGHKYWIKFEVTCGNNAYARSLYITQSGGNITVIQFGDTTNKVVLTKVVTATNTQTANFGSSNGGESDWVADLYEKFAMIDLTQMFNGDIPEDLLDHPENFFRYYQGSLAYNTGELVNANSRYIKCIGRQQWDEEWENGFINTSTGANQTNSDCLRSKNYIRVVSGIDYYCYAPNNNNASNRIHFYFYDVNKNFIKYRKLDDLKSANGYGIGLVPIPANCAYIRFAVGNLPTPVTYNNDITISIYYSGESGYNQYYPYEVLTNTDTGDEVLRSAGSVKDYKTPDGVVHRVVGTVDLSTLSWGEYPAGYNTSGLASLIKIPATNVKPNIISTNGYVPTSVNADSGTAGTNEIVVKTNGDVTIRSSSTPTGYLYYELATPTTEQGTTFSENLVIDDFGSMEFSGTSGVPQGNLIFYPVDYKAFVDTLYNYTEGTPSNLVLQSERTSDKSAQSTVDTQLQNAIGGTLRQCLCVKETLDFDDTAWVDLGTLTFGDASADGVFSTTDLNSVIAKPVSSSVKGNIICSIYKNVSRDDVLSSNMAICVNEYGSVIMSDTTFSNKTALEVKAAMKGVLLAYEKA